MLLRTWLDTNWVNFPLPALSEDIQAAESQGMIQDRQLVPEYRGEIIKRWVQENNKELLK